MRVGLLQATPSLAASLVIRKGLSLRLWENRPGNRDAVADGEPCNSQGLEVEAVREQPGESNEAVGGTPAKYDLQADVEVVSAGK